MRDKQNPRRNLAKRNQIELVFKAYYIIKRRWKKVKLFCEENDDYWDKKIEFYFFSFHMGI